MHGGSHNSKLITAAQMTDSDITIVRNWFIAGKFPARTQDFAPASHDLKSYWVGRKSLFLDDKGILWRNRSDTSSRAQLVVPRNTHAELERVLPSGEEDALVTSHQPPAAGLISRQQDTYFIPPPSRAVGGARGRSVPVSTATLELIHRQDPALAHSFVRNLDP